MVTENAYRNATAAKNISMQIKRFCHPAATVPVEITVMPFTTTGSIALVKPNMANKKPSTTKHKTCPIFSLIGKNIYLAKTIKK